MTIDERLEYITTLQQTHDEQIGRLVEQGQLLVEQGQAADARMKVLTERTMQAMDAINRLARIADNHENRIEDIGNQRPS